MAITQYYVDPAIAGDSGTGTIGDPYGDLQYALNTVTRDATNGDQINIKAGTAEVLAASLSLTTYGTPTLGAPLILRGYTSAANDGGMGEIDCGGVTMFAASNVPYMVLINLECHTFGDNNGIVWSSGGNRMILGCVFHKGASTPSGKTLLAIATGGCYVAGSHIYDAGTSGVGVDLSNGYILGCYIANCATSITRPSLAINNILQVPENGMGIAATSNAAICIYKDNVVWSSSSTGTGIDVGSGVSNQFATVIDNIVVGFSGAGGKGIEADTDVVFVGHNAFYNNTANYSIGGDKYLDLTANDVALAADPFTDAANGDFSLTAAAKTALAAKGWPTSYLGAHANTVPNLNIGPIQMAAGGAAGGGFPILGGSVVR